MGALKSALTAIFNANTYTSSTSGIASKKIPVTESNGLPSGQIGMSDLASVLGAPTPKGNLSQSANGVFNSGVYNVTSGSYDTPYNYGILLIFESDKSSQSAYILQVFFERKASGQKIYWRTGTRTGGYYESWVALLS